MWLHLPNVSEEVKARTGEGEMRAVQSPGAEGEREGSFSSTA